MVAELKQLLDKKAMVKSIFGVLYLHGVNQVEL